MRPFLALFAVDVVCTKRIWWPQLGLPWLSCTIALSTSNGAVYHRVFMKYFMERFMECHERPRELMGVDETLHEHP